VCVCILAVQVPRVVLLYLWWVWWLALQKWNRFGQSTRSPTCSGPCLCPGRHAGKFIQNLIWTHLPTPKAVVKFKKSLPINDISFWTYLTYMILYFYLHSMWTVLDKIPINFFCQIIKNLNSKYKNFIKIYLFENLLIGQPTHLVEHGSFTKIISYLLFELLKNYL